MKDSSIDAFSKRLRGAIEASGLTDTAVKHLVRVTGTPFSKWIDAEGYPSALHLIALSEVLSVSIDWLLTGESP